MKDLLEKIDMLAKHIFSFDCDYYNKTVRRYCDGFTIRSDYAHNIQLYNTGDGVKIDFVIGEKMEAVLSEFIHDLRRFIKDYEVYEEQLKEKRKAELKKELEELGK